MRKPLFILQPERSAHGVVHKEQIHPPEDFKVIHSFEKA
jgi:hypothetical protein